MIDCLGTKKPSEVAYFSSSSSFISLRFIHPSVFPSIFQSVHHFATGSARTSLSCLSNFATVCLAASLPVLLYLLSIFTQPFLLCVSVTLLFSPVSPSLKLYSIVNVSRRRLAHRPRLQTHH